MRGLVIHFWQARLMIYCKRSYLSVLKDVTATSRELTETNDTFHTFCGIIVMIKVRLLFCTIGSFPFVGHSLHPSQFQGLCLTKSSKKTLWILPYFIYMKTQSCSFCFSFHATLFFPLIMNEMKNGQSNFGFSYT